jgi:hypothetical protein
VLPSLALRSSSVGAYGGGASIVGAEAGGCAAFVIFMCYLALLWDECTLAELQGISCVENVSEELERINDTRQVDLT